MTKHPCLLAHALCAFLLLDASLAAAQPGLDTVPAAADPRVSTGTVPVPARLLPLQVLHTIGGAHAEQARLDELLGSGSGGRSLIRSPSSDTPVIGSDAIINAAPIAPEVVSVWNSALPFSFNEGTMWAGRGLNVRMMAGVRAEMGPVTLILAPQWIYQQNREYQIIPFTNLVDGSRNRYSSPWHHRPVSIDLPSRFGDESFTVADMGQSSLSARVGPVSFGVAKENLWWGPGIRNAIIMSNHAPGIPHVFLRTAAPLRTRLGEIEGRWILGRLDESGYFDDDVWNDVRSFSGLALELRPAFEPNLTLGFARAVYAPAAGRSVGAGAAFDVFRRVGQPNARPRTDLLREEGPDQLFSLFGRWVFPAAGLAVHGEWARYEEPASLRDLLETPYHSQGYTLGLEWAHATSELSTWRIQAEATYLEPSASYRERPVISWYTSRPVPQGYTQRGQVIGASIGPGASSQYLGADYFRGAESHVGVFGGRIRWENEAFYRPVPRPFWAHDVSLFVGARAAHTIAGVRVGAEYSMSMRMNYLFQNWSVDWNDSHAVDVRNHSLRISVSPAARGVR